MTAHKQIILNSREARRIALSASGLAGRFPFGRQKKAVLDSIRHLGYVQIDTISVVRRAQHHILYSRYPLYHESHLSQLVSEDCQVFEYWAHAAAYLPIEEYRYSLHLKQFFRDKKDTWPKPDDDVCQIVIKRIEEEGPLMARDFEQSRAHSGGWWNYKPAKRALERLFMEGYLMIRERRGMQKVYDLTERVLPGHIDTTPPNREDYIAHLVWRAITRFGLATIEEMSYLRRGVKKDVESFVNRNLALGSLVLVQVKNRPLPYFARPRTIERSIVRIGRQYRILNPFDPFVIQRNRLAALFNFDYFLECYVPLHKRQFGYFVLPLLYGDAFVGRLDAKAFRKEKKLDIRRFFFEKNVNEGQMEFEKLAATMIEFANFNQCESIHLGPDVPALIRNTLRHYPQFEVG